MYQSRFLQELTRLQQDGVAHCTATIVDARGSFPQEVGAKAVFTGDGLVFGTVGGGALEIRCRDIAAALLAEGGAERTRFARFNLVRDLAMSCAGEVAVFFEAHRPDFVWDIVIFGAGHVAQKLCRFLAELDCRVTCVDTRPEWLDRLPERVERRLVESYADGVAAVRPGAVVVVMTMGHVTDLPILHALQARGVPTSYLGVIGSEAKARTMRRQLAAEGLPPAYIESIICPIGDKLGDNTPPEIAVGVLAQLLRLRRRKDTP